jgi:hypothetical protein
MNGYTVCKSYRPRWTTWSRKTVQEIVTKRKRAARRAFRQYLRTDSLRDWNRSQKKIDRRDFD